MLSDSFAKIGVVRSMPGGDGMEVQFIGFPGHPLARHGCWSRGRRMSAGACSIHGL